MTGRAAGSELRPVRRVFRAVVATVVPEAAELDERGWSELEALVDESLRPRPRTLRRRLRVFLRLIQWAPVVRFGRPFTGLDPERRASVLRYLQDHRLRLVRVGFWGLRALALMGYYGRADTARAIGYRPHPDGWDAHPDVVAEDRP